MLAVCEMLVPAIAGRAAGTTFHVGCVVERYGLFTLIVLGEWILAVGNAVRAGLDAGTDVPAVVRELRLVVTVADYDEALSSTGTSSACPSRPRSAHSAAA